MKKIKYPRTCHLPFSLGMTSDDKIIKSMAGFVGRDIIVTEKMDGETSSLYRDGYHARSLDSRNHESRNWLKGFHASICADIPYDWRICGENVYAQHSLRYENLKSYFYAFSIWDQDNTCLSWDVTLEYLEVLGIEPVPLLYSGAYNTDKLLEMVDALDLEKQEGFVVRIRDEFRYADFNRFVAKWVRKGHVQTDTHWQHKQIIPNRLAHEILR